MLSSHPDDLQSQSHFLILTKRRCICRYSTLAFAVQCCFASSLTNSTCEAQTKAKGEEKRKSFHQRSSFACHGPLGGLELPLSLGDRLPDVLHHQNCKDRCWSGCGKSYGTTDTHPSPMPSCLEARRAGFLKFISKQNFVAEFVKSISV